MPAPDPPTCPMTRADLIERYFMEHRAKLIDVAAFLDRLDRAADGPGPDDFRVAALRDAIAILGRAESGRAAAILDHFSDHSSAPLESAAGMKGAYGAPPRD